MPGVGGPVEGGGGGLGGTGAGPAGHTAPPVAMAPAVLLVAVEAALRALH